MFRLPTASNGSRLTLSPVKAGGAFDAGGAELLRCAGVGAGFCADSGTVWSVAGCVQAERSSSPIVAATNSSRHIVLYRNADMVSSGPPLPRPPGRTYSLRQLVFGS